MLTLPPEMTGSLLKYKADLRSIGYIIVTTALFIFLWNYGFSSAYNWVLYVVFLHLAIAVSVMTHNHNHLNMWNNRPLNLFTDWWLTVFYGLPIFVWIPTHNRNHHRFNNKIEDTTRTYRHTEENDVLSILQYPSKSGYYQMKERIIPYMQDLKIKNHKQYRDNWMQIIALVVWMVIFFVWNWKKALLFVFIPQQVSQFTVMVFNYVQHVHADEESEYDHSRNFMGVNSFLFNNGYHTIHHHRASIHWSETPAEHQKIAHLIKPHLIQGSLWLYLLRTYVGSIFVPSLRSQSMRLERLERNGQVVKTTETEEMRHERLAEVNS